MQRIEILLHEPDTVQKQEELDRRIAKLHAQYVEQYIEKLNCPVEQKLKLIDAVVCKIRHDAEVHEQ